MQEYFDDFGRRAWDETPGGGPIRFAVVGLGGFARDYALPALAAADYCTPSVAVSGSPEKAARLVDDHDMDRALTYDEFAAGDGVDAYDAVYVVTPHAVHEPHVETAAELDKPVVCEKSLAATSEGARRIADTVEESGIPFMTAYRMQFSPLVRRARDLLAEGFVGRPVQVHGHFSVRMLEAPDEPTESWRLDPDLSGGTALVDLGLYPLNTTRFLLGSPVTAVQGVTRNPHRAFAETDEHVTFTLEFEDGTTATCTASHDAHRSSFLRVVGTEGQLSLDPVFFEGDPQGLTLERSGTRSRFEFEPVDQVREQFDYFAHCLLTGTDPEPGVREGLRDVELVEAVYDAAERGERIEV